MNDNNMPIVFMFGGQGSQYYHMGKNLYNTNEFFRQTMSFCDNIIKKYLGTSLIKIIYDENYKIHDPFDRIIYSCPALFMVQYALACLLYDLGIRPTFLLGYSLGEFIACTFSKVITFEQACITMFKHSMLIESKCERGGMLSILSSSAIMETNRWLFKNCYLTSVNFDKQFVVSGKILDLKNLSTCLENNNIDCQFLPVNYCFHCELIENIKDEYLKGLHGIYFKTPVHRLISATFCETVTDIGYNHFWEVMRKPILFKETIAKMEKKGNYIYIDLSPSGTLATFVKYNLAPSSSSLEFSLLTPFGNDVYNLNKLKEKLL